MSEEKKCYCCLCKKSTDENSAVLAYGAFGTPRLLCPDCEGVIEAATEDKEPAIIKESIRLLGERMTDNAPDDLTIETLNGILSEAAERCKEIEQGEYDFSKDAVLEDSESAEEFDEIPEELLESEEDRALDEEDRIREAKFNKIFNIIFGVIIAAMISFALYFVFMDIL